MIVGFAGKKQSGKSTAARHLLLSHDFITYSFAEPLKEMGEVLLAALGLTLDEIYEVYEGKEQVIHPIGVTWRQLLQTLGTEWGRTHIHPDLWVMCAREFFEQNRHCDIVIDDVRFENEAALIREMGGVIIHVFRNTDLVDDHSSERGIKPVAPDFVCTNEGSIDSFQSDLDNLVWSSRFAIAL